MSTRPLNETQELFSQFGPNSGFIQELYEHYLTDPTLVGEPWISFFRDLESAHTTEPATGGVTLEVVKKQAAVSRLIDAYRSHGHFHAKINPLSRGVRLPTEHEELQLTAYGLSDSDLQSPFFTDGLLSEGTATLSEILSKLLDCYCRTVGFEFMHLASREEREFLMERVEAMSRFSFSKEEKTSILKYLIEAETLEGSLHKRYVGQKRFSLEGGETVIPMLSMMLESLATVGAAEVRIGMPHRGRLSVLVNIAGKPLEVLFSEFEDRTPATVHGSGDVKYHLGYSSSFKTVNGRDILVSLCPNPSHLEFVNPVVEGLCRADQDIRFNRDRTQVVPVVLHGEAAFSGQGVVYETLNLAGTAGFDTGGTIHLIVNNQVGFTADPSEQRGTYYCSDLAKGMGAPVFHVNAEDIETACWVMQLASEYRQKFGKEVFVDLICHRKYGHNEGDDPTFTQPLMYSEIKNKKPLSVQYSETLQGAGSLTEQDYESLKQEFLTEFETASEKAAKIENSKKPDYPQAKGVKTAVSEATLRELSGALIKIPEGFTPHQKLLKILEKRSHAVIDGEGIEWGVCEGLAFGSLLKEGVGIRLTGQDVGRGTFSHRHAILTDTETDTPCIPMNSVSSDAQIEIYNSVLSEAAVVGFEYGYSHASPKELVLWEAQFGDFANGAQVHMDQFIASSEVKWGFRSGVVLLLPHGYEGQGPEHSSARLERYLQLCAEDNMSVCYPSNGAQYFHLLRRQGLMDVKRPLVVMTPKSLLRLPDAAVKTADLANGSFQPAIVEVIGDKSKAKTAFCMTGKVYYDVIAALKEAKKDALIIRIEELYPTPAAAVQEAIKKSGVKDVYWVQEEPKNMGAWRFISEEIADATGLHLKYIGRAKAASTATGSGKHHLVERKEILDTVLKNA